MQWIIRTVLGIALLVGVLGIALLVGVLGVALLVGVYHETGPWATVVIALTMIACELAAKTIRRLK